eukprot:Clim_evm19s233 gene=Clim_evmTU19s233
MVTTCRFWCSAAAAAAAAASTGVTAEGVTGVVNVYEPVDTLLPVDPQTDEQFGTAVAISSASASLAVVGSPARSEIYAFPLASNHSAAGEPLQLIPPNRNPEHRFGSAVAVDQSGRYIIGGAPMHDDEVGAAFSFIISGNVDVPSSLSVGEPASLVHTDGVNGDRFGWSVSMDRAGVRAAVGAPGRNRGQGAVYLYSLNTRTESYDPASPSLVEASDGEAGDNFGSAVALSGEGRTLVVGANRRANGGAVYVFWDVAGTEDSNSTAPDGSDWRESAILEGSTTTAGDDFGSSVSISGDGLVIAVAATNDSNSAAHHSGTVTIFVKDQPLLARTYTERIVLSMTDGEDGEFGTGMDMSYDGRRLLVGAYNVQVNDVSNAGIAALYDLENLFEIVPDVEANRTRIIDPNGPAADAGFGRSVALSADGAVALVGSFMQNLNSVDPPLENVGDVAVYDFGSQPEGPDFGGENPSTTSVSDSPSPSTQPDTGTSGSPATTTSGLSNSTVGVIVGVTVGCVALLSVVALLLVRYHHQKQRQSTLNGSSSLNQNGSQSALESGYMAAAHGGSDHGHSSMAADGHSQSRSFIPFLKHGGSTRSLSTRTKAATITAGTYAKTSKTESDVDGTSVVSCVASIDTGLPVPQFAAAYHSDPNSSNTPGYASPMIGRPLPSPVPRDSIDDSSYAVPQRVMTTVTGPPQPGSTGYVHASQFNLAEQVQPQTQTQPASVTPSLPYIAAAQMQDARAQSQSLPYVAPEHVTGAPTTDYVAAGAMSAPNDHKQYTAPEDEVDDDIYDAVPAHSSLSNGSGSGSGSGGAERPGKDEGLTYMKLD